MDQFSNQNQKADFSSKIKAHWKTLLIIVVAAAIALTISVVAAILRNDREMVRGIDVSAYQGEVDWDKIADQGFRFAYIKATEGTAFTDKKFKTNWKEAKEAGLYRGAYCFISLSKSGSKQADHFLKTVPSDDKALPPVVDFELYGTYLNNPPTQAQVDKILKPVLKKLKAKTGKTPIIYTNYNTYNQYIKNGYKGVSIWICDLSNTSPKLSGGHHWVFWQHTQRAFVAGIADGQRQFVDLDIFNGNFKQFKQFVKQ
ncbi:glycoside hydrolase family 25 protein [Pseudoramibacter sp.]|uniref:glycoside hydrolase family 25 protein n=1 Tax=Pseudoramibacter sp. TaxID=2034862 RepID=UPI0026002282|nr:GH25 family lysozyme [Pseudoramibacter sp.]MCH4073158.1 glycosyl hydrolase family 25 [Pseudoramibacter sp.]MCH4106930.1 glycosyl hydrolase family 25 [Pseudoramibacter sp.]